ncbi:MAG: hypothetical protein ACRCYQ_03345 [Nocardioides sp.]
MRKPPNVLALALALAAMALALTGCGSGGDEKDKSDTNGLEAKSASTILEEAVDAMNSLESVRLSGSVNAGGGPNEIDFVLTKAGACQGTVSSDAGTAEVIQADGESFIKADRGFWEAAAGAGSADQILQLVGDKWAKAPNGESGFEAFCDLDTLLEDLDGEADGEKGKVTEVGDTKAIKVADEKGEATAWISLEGKPYILKVEATGDDEGTLTFSDFDQQTTVEAPADGEVVDLANPGG